MNWRVVTRPAHKTPVTLDFNPGTPLYMLVVELAEDFDRRRQNSDSYASISVGFDFAVPEAAPGETIEGEIFLRNADPEKRYRVRLTGSDDVRFEGPDSFVLGGSERRKVRVKASLQTLSRILADVRELGGEVVSEEMR
jgi:hypothetical protein